VGFLLGVLGLAFAPLESVAIKAILGVIGKLVGSLGSAADGRAGLAGLLGLLPPGARLAAEQVTMLWDRGSWQPPLPRGISGSGGLLWTGPVRDGQAWQGYGEAAAGYPAPVIMVVPPGAARGPASGGSASAGYFRRAFEVQPGLGEAAGGLLRALGRRAGVLPVVIALHPGDADELAGLGAWLVRPARASGRPGVNLADSAGPGRPAGLVSDRGWELVSPRGARRSLEADLLEGAAARRALGIALAAPNPVAGLVRIAAGWYVAGRAARGRPRGKRRRWRASPGSSWCW
jgi:hypothetical protein